MKEKLKLYGITAAVAAVVICAAVAAFTFLRSPSLLSALPEPDETRPYALTESGEGCYPAALSSLLTEGMYAYYRAGTARNCVLLLAAGADECALLVQGQPDGSFELYAALRLSKTDMRQLKKGELPDYWKNALQSPSLAAGKEKGLWVLRMAEIESPLYIKTDGGLVLMAADEAAFRRLASPAGNEKSAANHKWKAEKQWPAHVEISDGGLLAANKEGDESVPPLKLQAAWQKTDKKSGAEAGEAKWVVIGAEKRFDASVLKAFEAKKWDMDVCIIPEPLLLSVGLNISGLKGSPEDWPFPLSAIGEFGRSMKLSDSEIREALSGRTIFSLGGQNRLLWFTLPGFTVELTGDKDKLEKLVGKFWDNLFLGAEPKPLKGFEYGGAAVMPFSVVGAGRGDTAILGLASPESLSTKNRFAKLLREDEKAIGWAVADLPRIGAALSDMTKMGSFVEDEGDDFDGEDGLFDDELEGEAPADTEPFQPEENFTPFDQGVTDSFSSVLKGLGRVLVVWETPDSGRVHWFRGALRDNKKTK